MAYPPFSPEEIARAQAYYEGTPGENMSPAVVPPPDPASYFGPTLPPAEAGAPTAPLSPPPNATGYPSLGDLAPEPLPTGGPTLVDPPVAGRPPAPIEMPPEPREATFERETPPAAPPMASPPIAPKPRPVGVGGGDFGAGKARSLIRGTFDEEKGALRAGSAAEQDRAVMTADRLDTIAREKQEDAAIAHAQAEEAERGFQEYRAETQRQIDAIRETQIGSRLYSDDGSRILAVLGGVVGGLYQGVNRLSSNPFIDQLNKEIDREIAIQEKNLANQKEAVAERRSMLSEMRSSFKDRQLAEIQARNLYYEGAKVELEAANARFDSPLVQARTEQAIAGITREQGKLDLEAAMRKAADARAAAAAKLAAEERAWKRQMEEREMRVKEGKLLVDANEQGKKAGNDRTQRFVATGTDPQTGNPTGFFARSKEDAEKTEEKLRATQSLLDGIDRALAIRAEQGMLGRTTSRNGPLGDAMGIPRPEWQTQVRLLEKSLNIAWMKAQGGLGTYDNGIERLMDDIAGNLDSRGSSADEKLRELRSQTMAAREWLIRGNAGPAATKSIDPQTGEEVASPTGGFAGAPYNQKSVRRFDVNGNPKE